MYVPTLVKHMHGTELIRPGSPTPNLLFGDNGDWGYIIDRIIYNPNNGVKRVVENKFLLLLGFKFQVL